MCPLEEVRGEAILRESQRWDIAGIMQPERKGLISLSPCIPFPPFLGSQAGNSEVCGHNMRNLTCPRFGTGTEWWLAATWWKDFATMAEMVEYLQGDPLALRDTL